MKNVSTKPKYKKLFDSEFIWEEKWQNLGYV